MDDNLARIKIKSKVFGNKEWVSIILLEYLDKGILSSDSKKNDLLISFRRENSDIYTYWGKLCTYIWEHKQSNEIYFKKVD